MGPKACVAWVLTVVLLSLTSCSSANFARYNRDMFEGKRFYDITDYDSARSSFLHASVEEKTPASLAWAATSSYKMGDLETAARLVNEAHFIDTGSISSLRIRGFKALILFAANRKPEGLDALREYVDLYGRLDPLTSIGEVNRMAQTGRVDLLRLQLLIDEQVRCYESDMEQLYAAGTGFYANKWNTRMGAGFKSW